MPSLTDGEIRRALKQVEETGKQLTSLMARVTGPVDLVLVMKPMPTRVTADWMAQQWRDREADQKKLGSYPSMSLSTAREVFNRDFANLIQKGRSIKIAGDTRPGTVADLFEAYVANLKKRAKSSWKEAEKRPQQGCRHAWAQSAGSRIEPGRNHERHPTNLRARQAFDGGSCPQLHPLCL